MVEVALEAALKDKQDMNQMPKAKNKEAGKEDSRKQQCSKCGSGASNSSSTGNREIVKLPSPTLIYRMETLGRMSNPCNLNKLVK